MTKHTHTPLAGRDSANPGASSQFNNFYSHAPRGARPGRIPGNQPLCRFLLTRPSRGATLQETAKIVYVIISTHTPLAGRDLFGDMFFALFSDFYSHAPRGARRSRTVLSGCLRIHFYSHAPRGARPTWSATTVQSLDFYSHAPRGARRLRTGRLLCRDNFYSHAPRGARLA